MLPIHSFIKFLENYTLTNMKTNNHTNILEMKNKLAKHWWAKALNPSTGKIDYSLIDGSNDFSIIPTDSKGKVKLEVGEIRSIIDEVWKQAEAIGAERERERTKEKIIELSKNNSSQNYIIALKDVMEYLCRNDISDDAMKKLLSHLTTNN